jgi:hypothetical protein
MTAIALYTASLVASFDNRASYEAAKNADNSSIQDTLRDMRKTISHEAVSSVFYAAHVDCNFINKSERVNARFNVYAAEKVINVAQFAAASRALNHYTRAILLSAYALSLQSMTLTHKDAQACCSLDVKTDAHKTKHLVRYQKHIAANTASTQSSSSINALQMFNVLREARDDANNVVYSINLDSEVTRTLLQRLDVKLQSEDVKSEDNAE